MFNCEQVFNAILVEAGGMAVVCKVVVNTKHSASVVTNSLISTIVTIFKSKSNGVEM